MKKRIAYIVIVVCLLIAFGATVTVEWLYDTFGNLSMDEIIFHLKVPMEGTNTDIIFSFMKQCLWKVITNSNNSICTNLSNGKRHKNNT